MIIIGSIKNSAVQMTRLRDIAAVLPGFSTGSALEHDADGTHQVILSKHLQAGLPYTYSDADEFRINPVSDESATHASEARGRKLHTFGTLVEKTRGRSRSRDTARYELRRGDVLFMSRGTRNVATRIVNIPSPSIAPVSFFVLRAVSESLLDPAYLTWYLNSAATQNDIASIRTGAGTPIVQRAAFQELAIPLPDIDRQRQIGEVGELMVQESLMHDRLADAIARYHDATSTSIRQQLLSDAHKQN